MWIFKDTNASSPHNWWFLFLTQFFVFTFHSTILQCSPELSPQSSVLLLFVSISYFFTFTFFFKFYTMILRICAKTVNKIPRLHLSQVSHRCSIKFHLFFQSFLFLFYVHVSWNAWCVQKLPTSLSSSTQVKCPGLVVPFHFAGLLVRLCSGVWIVQSWYCPRCSVLVLYSSSVLVVWCCSVVEMKSALSPLSAPQGGPFGLQTCPG